MENLLRKTIFINSGGQRHYANTHTDRHTWTQREKERMPASSGLRHSGRVSFLANSPGQLESFKFAFVSHSKCTNARFSQCDLSVSRFTVRVANAFSVFAPAQAASQARPSQTRARPGLGLCQDLPFRQLTNTNFK